MASSKWDLIGIGLPEILLVGGGGAAAVAAWYYMFGGKAMLDKGGFAIGSGAAAAGNGVLGGFQWIKDYSLYIFGAGVGLRLLLGRPKNPGVAGGVFYLTSWAMIIVGGLISLTNIDFSKNIFPNLPNPGALLRGAQGQANYAMPTTYTPSIFMPRQYHGVGTAEIVTGTQQNGSVNPAYDKNTVFPVLGDVY